MKHTLRCWLALLCLCLAGDLRAQTVHWEQCTFPAGLLVSALAIDADGILFAGTPEGVYRSTDDGENWSPSNNGLTSLAAVELAVAPNGDVYAGTHRTISGYDAAGYTFADSGGLFRSSDDGESWSRVDPPAIGRSFNAIAFGPDGDIYAAATVGANAAQGEGVLHSTDNGATWRQIGLPDAYVSTLLVTDDHIFAGMITSAGPVGIHRAGSGGGVWAPANAGINFTNVNALAGHGAALYATTSNHLPTHDNIYRSIDDGEHWQGLGLANSWVGSLVINTRGELFAGIQAAGYYASIETSFGVQRSTDGGATWAPFNEGLDVMDVLDVRALLFDHQGTLYAGTTRGLFRTVGPASSVERQDIPLAAGSSRLEEVGPNPLASSVGIEFVVADGGDVSLGIYDMLGREVATLVAMPLDAGRYRTAWDAGGVPDGAYVCRLRAGATTDIRKLVVAR